MCEHGDEIVLDLPDNIDIGKKNRSISCDRCIATIITKLWKAGVQTLGCCCGHGKENPSIVMENGSDYVANSILSRKDPDRQWDIFQWQLIKVNEKENK